MINTKFRTAAALREAGRRMIWGNITQDAWTKYVTFHFMFNLCEANMAK